MSGANIGNKPPACLNCPTLNTKFTLSSSGQGLGNCWWQNNPADNGGALCQLFYEEAFGNIFNLEFLTPLGAGGGCGISYYLAATDFQCCASNVFSLLIDQCGECPATVTVTPNDCDCGSADSTSGNVVRQISRRSLACVHLGEATGELRECPTCEGNVKIKLMCCAIFGTCTIGEKIDGIACCADPCPCYQAPA
ncbi:MAG TPA: hypothetical protein VK395_19405 [Gemmataceae bacterium]|nr:hypothetical protein [Gemmataceae bacterium]